MSVQDPTQKPTQKLGQSQIRPTLSCLDAIAITVGIVVGVGIFETPSLIAANTGNGGLMTLAWILGGVISLVGALCCAELATTYPHPGGSYHYLMRAYGRPIAFLFAWARMTVIQPGSIVLLCFVFGDYASQIFSLGPISSSIYATAALLLFTGLNLLGMRQGKWTQNALTLTKVLGLLLVVGVGGLGLTAALPAPATNPTSVNFGLAMILVLLSYGGWNEAVYISAELRNVQRNMFRALVWSIAIISAIYLLVNLAYLNGLGISGMAGSEAVAADLMRRVLGTTGATIISLLIAIAALGSVNATVLTGARTNYALGQDFSRFRFLGQWNDRANTPSQALFVQAAICLGLILLGTWQRKGFATMVDYTAPVFWLFFLLTGVSLFILRSREPGVARPFRVPLYPLTPILFCLSCGYLLYASLAYTGIGALVGVGVVLVGIPLFFWAGRSPQLR